MDLQRAREALAMAHEESVRADAGPLHKLTEVEDAQWVRVALAERREKSATTARDAGRSRRARNRRWLAILGVRP